MFYLDILGSNSWATRHLANLISHVLIFNNFVCIFRSDQCWILIYPFAGDLGQTYNSNSTLAHYQLDPLNGQALLYLGDLSYADNYPFHDNVRWDSWGRFIERSAAYQPWIWTVGNHEVDWAPELVTNHLILTKMLQI